MWHARIQLAKGACALSPCLSAHPKTRLSNHAHSQALQSPAPLCMQTHTTALGSSGSSEHPFQRRVSKEQACPHRALALVTEQRHTGTQALLLASEGLVLPCGIHQLRTHSHVPCGALCMSYRFLCHYEAQQLLRVGVGTPSLVCTRLLLLCRERGPRRFMGSSQGNVWGTAPSTCSPI